jgi:DDE domain
VLSKLAYLTLCRSIQLLVLLARGDAANHLEILVLRHQLAVLRRRTERYANNRVECDHGRPKARLGPMRGLKQDCSARVIIAGHAFIQNLRRGHCKLAVGAPVNRRVASRSMSWPWWSDPGPRSRLQHALRWRNTTAPVGSNLCQAAHDADS